jgi:hypothetical protein
VLSHLVATEWAAATEQAQLLILMELEQWWSRMSMPIMQLLTQAAAAVVLQQQRLQNITAAAAAVVSSFFDTFHKEQTWKSK